MRLLSSSWRNAYDGQGTGKLARSMSWTCSMSASVIGSMRRVSGSRATMSPPRHASGSSESAARGGHRGDAPRQRHVAGHEGRRRPRRRPAPAGRRAAPAARPAGPRRRRDPGPAGPAGPRGGRGVRRGTSHAASGRHVHGDERPGADHALPGPCPAAPAPGPRPAGPGSGRGRPPAAPRRRPPTADPSSPRPPDAAPRPWAGPRAAGAGRAASVLAVARPTRRPVKLPGPVPTPMAPMSAMPMPASASTDVSCDSRRRHDGRGCRAPSAADHVRPLPTATTVRRVAVSMTSRQRHAMPSRAMSPPALR